MKVHVTGLIFGLGTGVHRDSSSLVTIAQSLLPCQISQYVMEFVAYAVSLSKAFWGPCNGLMLKFSWLSKQRTIFEILERRLMCTC